MDRSKLKEIADSVFKRYPNAEKVYVTSDGQAFFDEAHAKNHAAPCKKHKEFSVETFLREGKGTDGAKTGKTAKEQIADIDAAETIEAVITILDAEMAGEARKSVIEAANNRIKKLKTA